MRRVEVGRAVFGVLSVPFAKRGDAWLFCAKQEDLCRQVRNFDGAQINKNLPPFRQTDKKTPTLHAIKLIKLRFSN